MKINPKLYYLLSWTWGLLMTFIGACGALYFMARGVKPQKHAGAIYFVVGNSGWGGVSLGMFFFCSPSSKQDTKDHEFGHTLQNCIWGPLFPFVIGIPSMIRCYNFNRNQAKGIPNEEDYDAIWFEGQATKWGEKIAPIWSK